MALQIIKQQSIADQVYQHIKDMILSGELAGGDRIPEEKIAGDLGISRTPVREALKRLEAYGLIYIKPRSYAEVAKLDEEEIRSIADVRAAMEALIARLLAERMDEEQYKSLLKLAEECEEAALAENLGLTFEKDSDLHLQMARYTNNPYIYTFMEQLDAKIQLYRVSKCITLSKVQKNVNQHFKILDAIKDKNVQSAIKLMEKHAHGIVEEEGN
jgi:DNA-binding GntR family transcriptional regulator